MLLPKFALRRRDRPGKKRLDVGCLQALCYGFHDSRLQKSDTSLTLSLIRCMTRTASDIDRAALRPNDSRDLSDTATTDGRFVKHRPSRFIEFRLNLLSRPAKGLHATLVQNCRRHAIPVRHSQQQVLNAGRTRPSIGLRTGDGIQDRVACHSIEPVAKLRTFALAASQFSTAFATDDEHLLAQIHCIRVLQSSPSGQAIDDRFVDRHELRPCDRILRITNSQNQTFARFRPLAHRHSQR